MVFRELTEYQRRVFNKQRICPICGKEILDFDDFKMLRVRHRRNVYYNFIHKGCEYGEERIVWPVGRLGTQNS